MYQNRSQSFQLPLLGSGQTGSIPHNTPQVTGGNSEAAPFITTPQTASPGPAAAALLTVILSGTW